MKLCLLHLLLLYSIKEYTRSSSPDFLNFSAILLEVYLHCRHVPFEVRRSTCFVPPGLVVLPAYQTSYILLLHGWESLKFFAWHANQESHISMHASD